MSIMHQLRKNGLIKSAFLLLIICFWGFVDVPVFMAIAQIYLLVAFEISFLKKLNGKIPKNGYMAWGAVWIILCFVSILWSKRKDAAFSMSIAVFQVVFLSAIFTMLARSKEMVDFLIHSFVLAGIVLVIRLMIVTPVSDWGKGRFGMAIGMHVNAVSMNLLVSELFAFYKFFTSERKKQRLYYLLAAFVLSVIIIATASKKTVVFMVLGPMLMLLFSRDKTKTNAKRYLIIFAALGVFVFLLTRFPIILAEINDRMEGLVNLLTSSGKVDKSTADRQYLMKTSFSVFLKNPILGVGIGNNRFENALQLYAHSNPIEILANLGIIGFSIYYSLYLSIISKLARIKRTSKEARLLGVIFLCLMLMEIVCVIYETESIQIVIAAIWIAATVLGKEHTAALSASRREQS